MRINYYLIILCCFFVTSCDDDGTLFTGNNEETEEYNNNLSGDGCSESTLCYALDDLYYSVKCEQQLLNGRISVFYSQLTGSQ